MLRVAIIIFLVLSLDKSLLSQNNDLWFFSSPPLAVNFSNGSPVNIPYAGNNQLSSMECSAVIKDDNGSLLFYTQGTKLFDVNHQLLPNGDNLYGDESSMQGALFVPLPGNDNIIYLFPGFIIYFISNKFFFLSISEVKFKFFSDIFLFFVGLLLLINI